MTERSAASLKGRTILRILGAMAAGNLVWEVAQVPLYTLWVEGTWREIAYDLAHCTVGDVMIAATTVLLAVTLVGGRAWPERRFWAVAGTAIVLGVGYTIFSEWLNTEVRGAWAYRAAMPRLPVLGTGLTPVLQWLVVPAGAFLWARAKMRTIRSAGTRE